MDTNKILSADFLDIIFDDRNKEYGAYELRKTYQNRVTKSLVFTGLFVLLAFTGVVLANKLSLKEKSELFIRPVTIVGIPDEIEPTPIVEPPRRTEPQPVQTVQFTQIRIVDNDDVVDPPPTQDDLTISKIDVIKIDGVVDDDMVAAYILDEGKDIIENKLIKEPVIFTKVEIDAKFDGDWEKFLLRNLNANVPVENGASYGKYTVLIQFVVDIDGSVSSIMPLTTLGYGLEEEAIRVLKKATKWKPAIQNGRQVKAYRKQPITFQLTEE